MLTFKVHCSNYTTPNVGHKRCLNNVMNYDSIEKIFTLQNSLLFENTVYYKGTNGKFKKNSDVYS
jgi:hypothetical protein